MSAAYDPTHITEDDAEKAARAILFRHADTVDGMMERGAGRDSLLALLMVAWLEGSKAGLREGRDIATSTIGRGLRGADSRL